MHALTEDCVICSQVDAREAVATHHGATKVGGSINWVWATGFPTEAACNRYVAWLDSHGWENRGTYDLTSRDEGFGTRYRW